MADAERIPDDAEVAINGQLMKLAESYASCDRRSAEINDERSTIRKNAEKLGVPSKAFQVAVSMSKHMSEGERRDHEVGVRRMLKAIDGRQSDLWGEEIAAKQKARDDKRAAEQDQERRASGEWSSENERSDPKKGGAGKARKGAAPDNVVPINGEAGKGDPGDALIAKVAAKKTAEAEQREGAAILDRAPGKPKSQSAIAAEKLEAVHGTTAPH